MTSFDKYGMPKKPPSPSGRVADVQRTPLVWRPPGVPLAGERSYRQGDVLPYPMCRRPDRRPPQRHRLRAAFDELTPAI
jgi:hypothetical protein